MGPENYGIRGSKGPVRNFLKNVDNILFYTNQDLNSKFGYNSIMYLN